MKVFIIVYMAVLGGEYILDWLSNMDEESLQEEGVISYLSKLVKRVRHGDSKLALNLDLSHPTNSQTQLQRARRKRRKRERRRWRAKRNRAAAVAVAAVAD